MAKELFATRYSPIKSSGLKCQGPSRTKQSFKDECDINRIIEKYQTIENYNAVLALRGAAGRKPQFGDFSVVPDYVQAQNTIAQANEMFAALPSNIRDRFMNNPALFLDFMSNPDNKDEAIRLGLCSADPVVVKADKEVLEDSSARQEARSESDKTEK